MKNDFFVSNLVELAPVNIGYRSPVVGKMGSR